MNDKNLWNCVVMGLQIIVQINNNNNNEKWHLLQTIFVFTSRLGYETPTMVKIISFKTNLKNVVLSISI